MLPPVAQVIQQTAKPLTLNRQAEALCSHYEEEIRKLGYEPIYELAPAIFRQQWEFGDRKEKSVPEIPAAIRVVYCSFADYARGEVIAQIEKWGVEASYLLFPEIIPFDSRRRICELTNKEYTDKIEKAGLWTRFAVGRSYVSLKSLKLQQEEFLHEGDDWEGLTEFWLEKTSEGKISLWGCVTEKDLTCQLRDINCYPINKQTTPTQWFVPIPSRFPGAELPPDRRLNPETPYRADYWKQLIPPIAYYCQQQNPTILAVSEPEEISSLEKMLGELAVAGHMRVGTISAYDGSGDLDWIQILAESRRVTHATFAIGFKIEVSPTAPTCNASASPMFHVVRFRQKVKRQRILINIYASQ